MLHRTLAVVLIASLLAVIPAGRLAAQGDGAGGIDQPVTLDSVQVVPVTVDVAVPVDGETVTTTLPLSAEVSVQVRLVENSAAPAEPLPDMTVEDATQLLPVLSEMPVGFVQNGTPTPLSSNEQVAAQYEDPTAFLTFLDEEVGRLGGVYVQFGNSQYAPFAGGNGSIRASVLVMEDAEGADLYLQGAMERELERSDDAQAVYRVSAPRLGDNSILYKLDTAENNAQFSEYSLWVRVNNALLTIDGRATRNMGNVDQLLTIARTILARGLQQPEQEEPVALVREEQPEEDTATQESAAEQPTPTPEANEAESDSTIWDLPHYFAGASDVMDVGGFQVQINDLALFDIAQVKDLSAENDRYLDNSAFQGATVFGVLDMTVTNGADQDLSLPSSDAVLVVGSEQVQLSDYMYLDDNPFGDALLPGVERQYILTFSLSETGFAELGDSVAVRLQMSGPITEGYDDLVDDAKFQTALTLTPVP